MEKEKKQCKDLSLRETARFLKRHDNFIILTHASPDGDTLGAGYALFYGLKEIGKIAAVICADVIPGKFKFFVHETDVVPLEGSTVIAVDVAAKGLLGSLEETFGDIVNLCIDHHISNSRFSDYLCLDANASATCEIIYELLEEMGVNINTDAANAMYTGIATDTGCFKYSNVTAKTHLIAAKLFEFEIEPAKINKIMFDTKSRNLLELERMVLDTAEYHFDNRCIILSVTAEMQEKTGCSGSELDSIAVISRCVEGVICGVSIKQTGAEKFKISLRTYPPLNASEIGKELGGGGHAAAAGASMNGSLNEIKEKILAVLKPKMEAIDAGISSC